jgi:FAD/FMN-containing dehydrogenase
LLFEPGFTPHVSRQFRIVSVWFFDEYKGKITDSRIPTIVGGGFAGTAGESSSFRYGFFDRTINWIEMVLANGEITKASSTENSDLFYGAASSFGTLGVTTLLEVQLIEAKTYVAITYHSVSSITEAQIEIQKATNDATVDYIDGVMYSLTKGVICVGRLTDSLPQRSTKIRHFTRRNDLWFYIHVQRLPHRMSEPIIEAIPLVEYLFRYDRGGFWVAKYAFKYFITPFNRVTRFILDYFMHTRVMYHALHQSGLSSQYIIQDVAIPYSRADEFMSYLHVNFKNYPIWLCPLKQSGKGIASTHSLQVEKTKLKLPEMMLNFGVWGPGPKHREEFIRWNRDFERKVHELGGQKWLYAHTYYTEEEFDEIYNREKYDDLRVRYHVSSSSLSPLSNPFIRMNSRRIKLTLKVGYIPPKSLRQGQSRYGRREACTSDLERLPPSYFLEHLAFGRFIWCIQSLQRR